MRNTITIRPARFEDVPRIMEIIRLCTDDLRKRGMENWGDDYPAESMFIKDIRDGLVSVACLSGEETESYGEDLVIGTVTITPDIDIDIETLSRIAWIVDTSNYICIARLGVDPSFHGTGVGGLLFDHANREAECRGFASVRLNVSSNALRIIAMYERRGFSKVGTIEYRGQPYDVMERAVPGISIQLIHPSQPIADSELAAIEVCQEIRRIVFIEGQRVDESIDRDGYDLTYDHLLLYRGPEAVGCLRLNTSNAECIKLERLAVLPAYRNLGLGKRLLREAISIGKARRLSCMTMHAQYYLLDYYKGIGFRPVGSPFYEANIRHIEMYYQL